jgi:chorismate synthase
MKLSNLNQPMPSVASTFGRNIKVTIFGGSHEPFIGVTLQGLPAGVTIDFDKMEAFLSRRAPGNSIYATPRKEPDKPIVQTGFEDGKTTGEPLTIIIENTNTRSQDYAKQRDIPRPAHADYTASIKYGETINMAGGGPFSARLTAPLCIAGAIAIQLLEERDIHIGAHIYSIENIQDTAFDSLMISSNCFTDLKNSDFPVLNKDKGIEMQEAIKSAMAEDDSVGGIVECCVLGLPVGIGGPMYDGIEGLLSSIYFGIPAVKGVEFGAGFESTKLRGSVNNDAFYMEGSEVKTRTNNHGGILGGISSGMPLISRLAFKPTPSISKEQDSVCLSKGTNEKLNIVGRHDPCVVLRAVPVVEAATAIGLFDLLQEMNF